MTTDHSHIDAAIASLGLTVAATFVPFSQSRNKAEKHPSLNWIITLKRNDRDVLTCDYSAGMAHCPGYSRSAPSNYDRPVRMWQNAICAEECERGVRVQYRGFLNGFAPVIPHQPIMPNARDVIYSLMSDASVLDSAGFEDWASEFGYDPDSRKAEKIYKACLDTALKLRSAIGDAGMEKLREAFQDY